MLGIEKVQIYSVHKHLASPCSVRAGMSFLPVGSLQESQWDWAMRGSFKSQADLWT